ncbi:conserved repeat domain-containing protein/Por secretion system C-terminal sorting domain-containing protein [Flavobacterium resistens]|uniref:Conserved repeat domain-containing protein/Por secretion system C-terminal sorting domain-containing protein n=1 Tax=Flavobacterium resistens TaxID=443612 RepID=A0A521AL22_9FLAO|nr:T9SS type A sorting domain-containing protein [Flavobacterium resistens]MRX69883.1 T9SS type A sorting domain-containing protein [Flavobacterium resistens]SMO35483.1 conserved repeat domain-containing protein/Por secretion system C-terminal sorting domain-containing protein [Flavobacterium resistens]
MTKNYLLLLALCIFSSAKSQIINFPDANFKARLLKSSYTNEIAKDSGGNKLKIDYNNDGEIDLNEASNVSQLNIDQPYFDEQFITDLSGINNFTNLTVLYCRSNKITNLDLTGLKKLKDLDCNTNLLTNLDLSYLSELQSLNCNYNQINKIELKGFKNLMYLSCAFNKLTNIDSSLLTNLVDFSFDSNLISSVDLSNNLNLKTFGCSSNKLKNLDISNLKKLERLWCYNNELSQLNLSAQQNLIDLQCHHTKLTSIDLSNLKYGAFVELRNNDLRSIFLKNGFSDNAGMILDGNPNLTYICCDENETENLKLQLGYLGYTNCVVNSYCTFAPGGTSYTILGNQKLDADNNGCNDADSNYTNLNFNITNGAIKGNIISDASGNYRIQVGEGTHTITPVLENPNYFTSFPESVSVTFPNENNTFKQNFCISPKGIHKDLEITILEILPARPGFDAKYKIIYKNKGTQTMSGSVTLDFNDAVLDFVSSMPAITNQSLNKLVWDYIQLKPFETREIEFTLNVNSPMETPPVNNNDRLSFNALITPITGDEKPVDNSFAMRQIVVGSFDPNDKTCLEGDVITPELIGEYVHYLIRFENTGTYPAENIVVKDMIDTSKFDISTLVLTNSSHSYTTKISDGNKVEFIFEKINLPFEDAHNDGYIAFKIKTLPTLKVGDSFTNEANIYFDYNFPILTNKATSTFKTLGISDFEFSQYFNVYPNPVKDVLNINSKNEIEKQTMYVYDVLGQLIISVQHAENTSKIDVSKLQSGNYFLKIKSDKGISGKKFIKL